MRLTDFHQLMSDVFGPQQGNWIAHTHHLPKLGGTPEELIDGGVNPSRVWDEICEDFDVPDNQRLGIDRPGF
ncbi:DUF3046 domain-containing protein [Corynebacterium yudongzhengii]|uniref:DUF3046 domain-containing protein n=1 Tax=Corynebacterium yudongzhengii TaxID=2080740 RepID=A0A2U1T5A9_9CORY|nr:DUF3046 domain-containing protein [Corynebacterium yudongzhengii]AWB82948.1 DUF3046 domain-containing protein [Corynebacterium yudongzhengii]PWC01196.1 DUF3046 domain-containing protein [Corynebacterium yudongzhengii]